MFELRLSNLDVFKSETLFVYLSQHLNILKDDGLLPINCADHFCLFFGSVRIALIINESKSSIKQSKCYLHRIQLNIFIHFLDELSINSKFIHCERVNIKHNGVNTNNLQHITSFTK